MKKVVFQLAFCLLGVGLSFVFPYRAEAQIPITITCPQDGSTYVVFAATGPHIYPPTNPKLFCVKLMNGQTSVRFSELVSQSNGAIPAAWQDKEVMVEKRQTTSLAGCSSREFAKDENAPVGLAKDYYFGTTPQKGCPNDPAKNQDWLLTRFAITVESNIFNPDIFSYVYALGEAPVPGQSQQSGGVAATSCSSVTDPAVCADTTNCFWFNVCQSRGDRTICGILPKTLCGPEQGGSLACAWNDSTNRCISALEQQLGADNQRPSGYKGPIPDCAFEGTCRDLNDLIELLVNAAKYLFGFMGTVALGFFVYGGFTIVMSMGNSEKVSEGKNILTAAVVGIVVAFAAYAAVGFVLDVLQVGPEFRVIGN